MILLYLALKIKLCPLTFRLKMYQTNQSNLTESAQEYDAILAPQ